MRHARATTAAEDYLAVPYHAYEVNAVMRQTADHTVRVYVTRDGAAVPANAAGSDLVHSDDVSYVTVGEPRMYSLVQDHHFGSHVLRLSTDAEDLELYAFTFGGCGGG